MYESVLHFGFGGILPFLSRFRCKRLFMNFGVAEFWLLLVCDSVLHSGFAGILPFLSRFWCTKLFVISGVAEFFKLSADFCVCC